MGMERIKLKLLVERITWEKEDWKILRCKNLDTRGDITAVGYLEDVRAGQTLLAEGHYEIHKQYGRQFRVEGFSPILPREEEGVLHFLSKGFVKGIGKTYAQRLYDKFGKDVLEIIDENPKKLLSVPGIGRKRQKQIISAWKKEKDQNELKRETMIGLLGLGFTEGMARRIWSEYKDNALPIARRNPYAFIYRIKYYGFQTADKIALSNGIAPSSNVRLKASIRYALEEGKTSGNTCLPRGELLDFLSEKGDFERDKVEQMLDRLLRDERLVSGPDDYIYLRNMYAYEFEAAQNVFHLLNANIKSPKMDGVEDFISRKSKIRYTDQQLRAIKGVFLTPMSIITGGPGTGKTTTLRAIIKVAEKLEWPLRIAAPTGRAAKRASESSGREAETVHRLLEYSPKGFQINRENPLNAKILVIDEMSMVDAPLFHAITEALKAGTHLVMIGDIDQLESVGPGAVLSELVKSDKVPVFRLTQIIRQGKNSGIVPAAHSLINGEMPLIENNPDGDIFFMEERDTEKAAQKIVELASRRLPSYYGIDPSRIQVLTPMHKGMVGTEYLNSAIRNILNPGQGEGFQRGDRVMQTENNYDLNVFNGDWGYVVKRSDDKLLVDFGRTVEYPLAHESQLTLAYAVTIHKSQGSEYDAVVLPVSKAHFIMLGRNLFYTAFTRAKKLLVLVGDPDALSIAVSTERKTFRHTNLAHYISLNYNKRK